MKLIPVFGKRKFKKNGSLCESRNRRLMISVLLRPMLSSGESRAVRSYTTEPESCCARCFAESRGTSTIVIRAPDPPIGIVELHHPVGFAISQWYTAESYATIMTEVYMVHPEIQKKLDQIRAILRDHQVEKAYVFGSAVHGTFSSASDFDLLVEFGKDINPDTYADLWWNLVEKLETVLQRPVDLVTVSSITNRYFKMELERTREAIL